MAMSRISVCGHDPELMHQLMGQTMDNVMESIRSIQHEARANGIVKNLRWPMIVLKSPKGWTGPAVVDGVQIEGTFRAHQVPLDGLAKNPEHIRILERWMKSYKPEELFDANGTLMSELAELAPKGHRRMGANPHANGADCSGRTC